MSLNLINNLVRGGILQVFLMCAPILGAALLVGLIVAIFQATTSIQEQTLTFLPKFLTILFVIALLGGFMFNSLATKFIISSKFVLFFCILILSFMRFLAKSSVISSFIILLYAPNSKIVPSISLISSPIFVAI